MSELGQRLYDAMKRLNTQPASLFPGIVQAVNGNTANVSVDGLVYEGVQLQSTQSEGIKGVLITPAVGSVVLVQQIMDSNEYFVAMFSDVTELLHQTSQAKVLINDEGIELSAGGENVLDILVDLIEACATERHLTKSGPTISISTESQLKFEQIKTRVKKLFQNAG